MFWNFVVTVGAAESLVFADTNLHSFVPSRKSKVTQEFLADQLSFTSDSKAMQEAR